MKRYLGYCVLSLTLTIFLNGCSGIKSDKKDAGSDLLAGCPDRPNCVSSKALDEKHAVEPFQLKKDPEKSWKAIVGIVENLPRTTIVKTTDRYLHAECKSRLFGFIDDLELQLEPENGVIAIRSASRNGYYDFGVNRRRLSDLRQVLKENGLIR